jgi:hypothetical protein
MADADGFPRLGQLIREHCYTKYGKVLLCAPDVERALKEVAMDVTSRDPLEFTMAALMGINVIIAGDSPPGTWTLIRHDHCEVHIYWLDEEETIVDPDRPGTVTHSGCTILGRSNDHD